MKKFFLMLVLLLACMPLIGGCQSFTPEQIQQGRETVQKVKTEANAVVAILEAEAAKLPADDPLRAKIVEKIAKARSTVTEASKVIDGLDGVLQSLQVGQVTPDVTAALSFLPYGAYAGAGISLLLALAKHFKAAKLNTALRRVVQSWEETGDTLDTADKKKAATIQGPEVTALVHSIKTDLAQA